MSEPIDYQRSLSEISAVLLAEVDDHEALGRAVRAFHEFCAGICGIRGDGDQNRADDIHLDSGVAISPAHAAFTLFDRLRTKRFVRGLLAAIRRAATERGPCAGPVHVLYAGCGPFATLALPLLNTLPASAVRWTLLDIQPEALRAAQEIIERRGYTDRVAAFQLADAARYRHAGPPIDLVVTETMQNLLFNEPQVAITLHLASQLAPGGRLVPESIEIAALLVESRSAETTAPDRTIAPDDLAADDGWERLMRADEARTSRPLGELLRLDLAFARSLAPNTTELPPVRLELPPYDEALRLQLQTIVRVHDDIVLDAGNSPLCVPRILPAWRDHPRARTVEFQYRLGRTPGFRISFGQA